jgi:hypothetical protein
MIHELPIRLGKIPYAQEKQLLFQLDKLELPTCSDSNTFDRQCHKPSLFPMGTFKIKM